jgi:NADH-quinone oxidoreductase subunit E
VNTLLQKYPSEIEKILTKYPADQKRAAVMPLLYLAQRESGYVNKQALAEVGEILDISATDVGSIVGFYTLYHDHPAGKHRIQVCNDLPCALRGADQFLESLCENLGVQVGGTTEDGTVTIEAVMCLAGCDKAPMFQVQDEQGIRYFENQTVETAMQLVEYWRSGGATPEPSPQGVKAAEQAAGPQAAAAAPEETVEVDTPVQAEANEAAPAPPESQEAAAGEDTDSKEAEA